MTGRPAEPPSATVADRIARLSDGQRQCLELVLEHQTSKDIARTLGISPHAVDMRIRVALRVLEVDSRSAAALLLRSSRAAADDYQPLIYQPPELGHPPENGIVAPRPNEWTTTYDTAITTSELADVHRPTAWHEPHSAPPTRDGGWPWGTRNDLSTKQRLFWIGVIATSTTMMLASLASVVEALKRLL